MIDILLSSFNGDEYIENQILSLLQQSYKNWRLFVRDDFSSDNTVYILKKYAKSDQRIKIVNIPSDQKLGVAKSFISLLNFANSKYVMFCDQDDIWFEKKIEILLKYAEENFSPNIPSLVYCDAYGYSNDEGVIIRSSVSRHHAQDIRGLLFMNSGYQGCSMLFNQSLARMVRDYRGDYYYMHDDIVALLAHVFGKVHFIPKKLMLYRQHDKNVTGNIEKNSVKRLLKILTNDSFVIDKMHFEEKRSFYSAYGSEMAEHSRNIFEEYFSYPESSLVERLRIVWHNKFMYGDSMLYLLLKTFFQKPLG
jgi:rhamnosyltransferase